VAGFRPRRAEDQPGEPERAGEQPRTVPYYAEVFTTMLGRCFRLISGGGGGGRTPAAQSRRPGEEASAPVTVGATASRPVTATEGP
jgi:hypothetical protein